MKRILQITALFFCMSFLFCACGGAVAPATQTPDGKPSGAGQSTGKPSLSPTAPQPTPSSGRTSQITPSGDETQTGSRTETEPSPVTDETPAPSDGTPDEEELQVDLMPLPLSADVSTRPGDAASGELLFSDDALFPEILARFGFAVGQGGLPVAVERDQTLEEEEYNLLVKKEGITVRAAGEKGLRLAASTLAQLRCGDQIAACEIADKPAFPLRGVIEGFYGDAWTEEFRLDLFDFMGNYKLNTYIYAPKDDPKHRSAWRLLYTEKELESLSRLVNGARENGVGFVYAISPGLSIKLGDGYEKDFERLIRKCQQIYDLGVRDFAIFLDDIDSRDASGHAKLLNDFETQFIKTHEGCSDLIAISPEYETIWLTKYTDELAPLLHPDIVMMWTGNETIPKTITKNDLMKIDRIYGRKVFLWWNYPVNDMDGNSLFMGPAVNLDKDLPEAALGLAANPMNRGYASLLPLLTTSDYLWNPSSYDPERSARSAAFLIAPECAEGLWDLMDLLRASFITGWKSSLSLRGILDAYPKADAARTLEDRLQAIKASLDELEKKGAAKLLEEIRPWLAKANACVDAALALLRFDRTEDRAEKGKEALGFIETYRALCSMPQKVSEDALVPFISSGRSRIDSPVSETAAYAPAKGFTDCRAYQDHTVDKITDGNDGSFFWSDGTLKAASGGGLGYIGIRFDEPTDLFNLYISTGDGGRDALTRVIVEYTENEKDWSQLASGDLGPVIFLEDLNVRATAVRLRNGDTSSDNWVIVRSFEANTQRTVRTPSVCAATDLPTYESHLPSNACDGSSATFFWSGAAPGPGSVFTIDFGKEEAFFGVSLLMGSDAHPDDYLRRGVIEYSPDGKEYTVLCEVKGRETAFDGAFCARFVRLRCTASQTNWLIIREFTAKKRYALPEGFTMDGQTDFDLSPALDLSLFTSFSHSGKGLAGKALKIDVSGSASAELYLTRLSGISVFTENADKERAAVLPAPCAVIDLTNAVTLCVEFTGEEVGIAEIVIRQAPRN